MPGVRGAGWRRRLQPVAEDRHRGLLIADDPDDIDVRHRLGRSTPVPEHRGGDMSSALPDGIETKGKVLEELSP